MSPLPTWERLWFVAAGTAAWLIGRRSWFDGTKLLTAVLATPLILTALADVVLWWPL